MKKLIFVNCILAIAVIFSFCAKTDPMEEPNTMNQEVTAIERSCTYPCTVSNIGTLNNVTLTFCGTCANSTNCISCTSTLAQGVSSTSDPMFTIDMCAPTTFSVTASGQTSVNLTAGSNSTGAVFIPTGGCKRFTIDTNCNIYKL
ncbi:MAG: hypothetical protein H7246_13205 [Phycisphaerae bacterium]|nr:hypothetical protein [Saprospiraceae bacterium]